MTLHPVDLKLSNRLVKAIEELEREQIGPMINGALKDFTQYQWAVGYLKALEHVRGKMSEIEKEGEDDGPAAR